MPGRPRTRAARSRTRPTRPPGPPTASRVQQIVDLMVALRWNTPVARELASQWGVSLSRVQQLSAEAHRIVVGTIGDPEEMRNRILRNLDHIAAEALQAQRIFVDSKGTQHEVPAPNHDAAIRALLGSADLLGLKRTAVEVTGKDGAALIPGVLVVPSEDVGQFQRSDGGQAGGKAGNDLGAPCGAADPLPGKPGA